MEEILEEFLRIYLLPEDENAKVDNNVKVEEGGTYPAIDFIIGKFGEVFEVRRISARESVLLNEKDKTAIYVGLCNRPCEFFFVVFSFLFILSLFVI